VLGGSGAIPVYGSGTVRPRVQVDVAAGVSGRVVWVDPAFESGGRVTEGQVLFRIDDADYRHRVAQTRASVAVQQVELLRVEEEARIARAQFERFLSRQAGDAASADSSPLARWEPQLEAARAALERDRARLAEAELLLSRTEVQAPFDAAVRSETVGVGQFVTAGVGVGRIYASDAVEIVVSLPDADAALIPGLWELRAGSRDRGVAARVIAAHGMDRFAWQGTVDRVETVLDEATRTLDVIVRVPNPFAGGSPLEVEGGNGDGGSSPPLLVGQFVDVEIEGVTPEEYFRIQRLALRPGNEVWAVRGEAVTIVPVRVLQRFDDTVYVTGGLQEGQMVVLSGIQFATEGMRVRTASQDR
jgi:RND family efflux transporter MFP subunit